MGNIHCMYNIRFQNILVTAKKHSLSIKDVLAHSLQVWQNLQDTDGKTTSVLLCSEGLRLVFDKRSAIVSYHH